MKGYKESTDIEHFAFIDECDKLGVIDSSEKAAKLREIYLKYYPYMTEMKEHHERVKTL